MHYYQFNIGDYRRDTQHLVPLEHGIYRLLLDQYYLTEKPIDANALRLLCIRSADDVRIAGNILKEFFQEINPGEFIHLGCNKIIDKYKEKSEKASKSAKLRWDANALRTHSDGNANQEPLTKNKSLITTNVVITPELITELKTLTPKNKTTDLIKTTVGDSELQAACRETWQAYSAAYANRYAVDPVRNARVNTQVRSFVGCIGHAESPHVAAFYVSSNSGYYVKKGHAFGLLLSDAEKLRTEWATNHRITDTAANQIDKTQTNYDVWAPMIAEAEAREEKEKVNAQ